MGRTIWRAYAPPKQKAKSKKQKAKSKKHVLQDAFFLVDAKPTNAL
jgi:hypothetical protein